jgi:hypothetical protein
LSTGPWHCCQRSRAGSDQYGDETARARDPFLSREELFPGFAVEEDAVDFVGADDRAQHRDDERVVGAPFRFEGLESPVKLRLHDVVLGPIHLRERYVAEVTISVV